MILKKAQPLVGLFSKRKVNTLYWLGYLAV